jgi:hypothetical protein
MARPHGMLPVQNTANRMLFQADPGCSMRLRRCESPSLGGLPDFSDRDLGTGELPAVPPDSALAADRAKNEFHARRHLVRRRSNRESRAP